MFLFSLSFLPSVFKILVRPQKRFSTVSRSSEIDHIQSSTFLFIIVALRSAKLIIEHKDTLYWLWEGAKSREGSETDPVVSEESIAC